ncbi:hypothetical protein [Caproiciproducens faecalis]|uniref:Uncharacterized protein n=1 Tax=Caproiciproducens faecalis TaxID=2820301 RepID=A0ABS7DM93_9FIRM|nr:hypothetical protein [Caproiciproducens faecalis]MBW7572425.1 hypothetical protein [Caproiciproducens faecalis]
MDREITISLVAGLFAILGSILAIIGGIIQGRYTSSKQNERILFEKRLLVYEKLCSCLAEIPDLKDELDGEDLAKMQNTINEIDSFRNSQYGGFFLYSSDEVLIRIKNFFNIVDESLESGYFNEYVDDLKSTANKLIFAIRSETELKVSFFTQNKSKV